MKRKKSIKDHQRYYTKYHSECGADRCRYRTGGSAEKMTIKIPGIVSGG